MPKQIEVTRAYAKINIGLNILAKRADGYHDLETIFQQVSLFDEITFYENATEVVVHAQHPQVPSGQANIAHHAAKLLKDRFRIKSGIEIHVQKQIPVGAGLGGGSSDAALVLKTLNQIWQIGLSTGELKLMSHSLGADVAFFINGGSSLGRGRGEALDMVHVPLDYKCCLVYPKFSISTRWAYKNYKFDLTNTKKNFKLASFCLNGLPFDRWSSELQNDLEYAVFQYYPQLSQIKAQFYELGATYASMTGSGSVIYGLFKQPFDAEAEVRALWGDKYTLFICDPIGRS